MGPCRDPAALVRREPVPPRFGIGALAAGTGLVSNNGGDGNVSPRTLAGATILQIVPQLHDEPVARTAVNVASALIQSGARAIIAAENGPLADELRAFGGEWVELVNATVNPF